MQIQDSPKRNLRQPGGFPLPSFKKLKIIARAGFLYLRSLDSPMFFSSTDSLCKLICLRSDRLYTFGRKNNCCQIVFKDRRVSKRHCQIFFDGLDHKIYIVDGYILPSVCDLDEIRRRFRFQSDQIVTQVDFRVRNSSNGVFINGFRLERGISGELSVGDEVSFVRGNGSHPNFGIRVGFVVERIAFTEEIVGGREILLEKRLAEETVSGRLGEQEMVEQGNMPVLKANGISKDSTLCGLQHEELIARAQFLLSKCRSILESVDPICYIQRFLKLDKEEDSTMLENDCPIISAKNHFEDLEIRCITEVPSSMIPAIKNGNNISEHEQFHPGSLIIEGNLVSETMGVVKTGSIDYIGRLPEREIHSTVQDCGKILSDVEFAPEFTKERVVDLHFKNNINIIYSPAGKNFFLNRLEFTNSGSFDQRTVVSLPELLHPVESISRIFIATFTSDVLWFLSCCEVPNHLPITVACHNTERCWSASLDQRTSTPYSDYPNLVVVYPPFPDVIAFGKDRKKKGIACHHPKLLVLFREESIRVIVTSANLVPKQWNSVTNTVWWQDFPSKSSPDYSCLFAHLSCGEEIGDSKSDFAAQLAGFMASLVADVPSQADWIVELTRYDFRGAVVHLVTSIPGIHMQYSPYPSKPVHFLSANPIACSRTINMKFLGSIQASVVGLSHRFKTAADSSGAQLKTLASFLGKCQEDAYGMSEVVLKRNTNIPADTNAVSVLIANLDEFSEGEYIQLGFLPKNVAKWVAPLCDIGFLNFSAYICPKEVLAAALGGSNSKVQLLLYVSQGPDFSEISRLIQPDHIAAICSLVASLRRCVGLWRLQEVLCRYKWPEMLETDFVYGSSSIGTSVDAQFFAAFSAASGKRSCQISESEESDPEWGRWSATHESGSPSMRIIFPTIERVKNGACGIWPSRRLLALSERTWQRLQPAGIFHDAIPHPGDRVGYPMHVKVARRRFQSKTDSSSFGWIYCGSHNFSPAAWGRPMSHSSNVKVGGAVGICGLGMRLHICNYELGIIFLLPPSDISKETNEKILNLDDIVLPFVVPAPKYGNNDRPATAQAMREALAELTELEKEKSLAIAAVEEMIDGEISDDEEEETVDATNYVAEEKEEEQVYAETLWSQVDSSEG